MACWEQIADDNFRGHSRVACLRLFCDSRNGQRLARPTVPFPRRRTPGGAHSHSAELVHLSSLDGVIGIDLLAASLDEKFR